ncbi:MAP7 domain-containing protein 2-like [Populus alba x Populus x berolinensis]|nr:MAP7 domain-containing protein 2-like [Populus alba x Populus x berolinensis]
MQPCLKQSFVANSGLCVGTHFQPNVQQSNHRNSIVMNTCPAYASISTFPRVYDSAALQMSVYVRETTGSSKHFHSKISLDSAEKQTLIEEVQLDGYRDTAESINDLPKKGKGKKKHGNKGRIPWNKGRKHTAETRALINQRTTEALTNPQVRKKMSGHPHAHSEAIRAKISSSLRQIWGKRLKWKRLREKLFLSWSKSIARAAKEGGIDQQELDWDGLDKIKEEITLKQLQGAIEKAKAEERAKRIVEREAKEREEKMVRVAQKREKREEKIRKRKSINDQMIRQGASSTSHTRAWEKIDAEIKKSEKIQREGSLAEQIRDAKNKRTESITREAVAEPSTQHLFAG